MVVMTCAPLSPGVLASRQRAALERHDWFEAVRLGQARVTSRPFDIAARYDLACALARVGDERAALRTLFEAVALGFDDAAWLERDEDLASVRHLAEFATLRAEATRMARTGISVVGVRTVIRDDLPTPVRVRVPDLANPKPRVALWLHPSGARLNADLERLAPVFARHGFALVVPMYPRLAGWNNDELRSVLDLTLPRLTDVVEVDHPLVLGLSAGAEAALVAWSATPARFVAVWASAPPTDSPGHTLALPTADVASPVVFFIGERDPVWREWQRTWPTWRAAQLRFETRIIAEKGHELLFDEALLERELSEINRLRQ